MSLKTVLFWMQSTPVSGDRVAVNIEAEGKTDNEIIREAVLTLRDHGHFGIQIHESAHTGTTT